jgi:hypothetical protein
MMPHSGGMGADGAKQLLLKDTDYSTPTDHYFAYLQKLKTDSRQDIISEEDKIMKGLDIK